MNKRYRGTFRFADVAVGIKSDLDGFDDFAADYLYDGKSDFIINIKKRDVASEKKRIVEEVNYSDVYVERLAILRKFCIKAANSGVLLFHCSAVSVDGEAYLFAAPSGTGKSTHTRLWRKMLGERAVMVNDDKPFIRFKDGKPYVYGSPWNGKHRISSNISCPVKAICFIEQAAENNIRKVTAKDVFPRLCKQIFYSREEKNFQQIMLLAGKLAGAVPLYVLQCNISEEAASLSYNTMREDNVL